MDERRFQLSITVIFVILLFAIGRVLTNSNPLYSVLEPVITSLNNATKSFSLSAPGEELDVDTGVQIKLEESEKENLELREQLGLQQKFEEAVSATVVRRDMFGFAKQVWVDAGLQDGIKKGDTVLADGTLFGRIDRVYESSAAIQLVVDPQFRATVVSANDTHGILKVDHGSVLIDLLPGKELEGEKVETDGLDANFSSGVLIGELGAEQGEASDVFGKYPLRLPYNPIDIDFVSIITRE